MFKNKWIKRLSIALASVIAVFFVLNFAITYFINKKLPEIIAEKNDTPYNFTYKDLSFSIFTSSLSINGIEMSQKESLIKNDSVSKIKEIDIVGINLIKLFKKNEFSAYAIKFQEPKIYYYSVNKKSKEKSRHSKFKDSFDINRIEFNKGNFYLFKENEKVPQFKVNHFDVLFTGVTFDSATLSKKIPFQYNEFKFRIDSIRYQLKDSEVLVLNNLKIDNKGVKLDYFQLKSNELKSKKNQANQTDKDLIDIETKNINFSIEDWGIKENDQLYLTVNEVNVNNPIVNLIPSPYKKEKKQKIDRHLDSYDLLNIKQFNVKDGKFYLWYSDASKTRLSVDGITSSFNDIKLNKDKIKNLPVDFGSFNIATKALNFDLNNTQNIVAESVNLTNDNFVLNSFELKPKLTSRQFLRNETASNVLLYVKSPSISLANNQWDLVNNQLEFKTKDVNIDEVDVEILAEKQAKLALVKGKHLVNANIEVDNLHVNKSNINSRGKYSVNNFSIALNNVKNEIDKGLSVSSIIVNKPSIIFYKQVKNKTAKKINKKIFNYVFNFNNIQVNNGTLQLIEKGNKIPKLDVKPFQLSLNQVKVNSVTVNNPLPFTYKGILFKSTGVNFDINKDYNLSSSNIKYNNGSLIVNKIDLSPKVSRSVFVDHLKVQEDLYTLRVNQLIGTNVDCGLDINRKFYFNSDNITLNNLYADIFRSQVPPPNTKIKTMFSEKLRNLKFGLGVKNIKLVNSTLIYEEEAMSNGIGKLTFSNINTNISNFNSGFNKKTLPDVVIDWNSEFMGAKMDVLWTFNPMNKSEDFKISGNIKNMLAPNLDPFLVPYLKISAQGNLDAIVFDFSGNNLTAKGLFNINYDHLKVSLLRKDGKKRKFLSAVGNALISKNTGTEGKKVHIKEVKRNQEKSFFNFFLACILEGLKETILII